MSLETICKSSTTKILNSKSVPKTHVLRERFCFYNASQNSWVHFSEDSMFLIHKNKKEMLQKNYTQRKLVSQNICLFALSYNRFNLFVKLNRKKFSF